MTCYFIMIIINTLTNIIISLYFQIISRLALAFIYIHQIHQGINTSGTGSTRTRITSCAWFIAYLNTIDLDHIIVISYLARALGGNICRSTNGYSTSKKYNGSRSIYTCTICPRTSLIFKIFFYFHMKYNHQLLIVSYKNHQDINNLLHQNLYSYLYTDMNIFLMK